MFFKYLTNKQYSPSFFLKPAKESFYLYLVQCMPCPPQPQNHSWKNPLSCQGQPSRYTLSCVKKSHALQYALLLTGKRFTKKGLLGHHNSQPGFFENSNFLFTKSNTILGNRNRLPDKANLHGTYFWRRFVGPPPTKICYLTKFFVEKIVFINFFDEDITNK